MSHSVARIQDGHIKDKMAHERDRSRVAEEVHAALVIQGCWRAHKNLHRPRKQAGSKQAGLNAANLHEAVVERSPADAFEAALTEALARQSLPETGRTGNSKGTGQDKFTLTPPNTPALGTSPPTGGVPEARASGGPSPTAMHAIPEEVEKSLVETRAALPAPTVQPNKEVYAAAAVATSSQAPVNAQVTDLASVIMPEQYSKLIKEPTSPATAVGSQAAEAVQLGREWSVPVAGTLHVDKALKNLEVQGEQADPQAMVAQERTELTAPPHAGTPAPDPKSNGYTTDVEDETAGGPKGDLQDHISRNLITSATETAGGTAEARALASYEQFPPPPGPAEQREGAGQRQLGGQLPQQQELSGPGVTGVSDEQTAKPRTSRRMVLQEQAAPEALAPTPQPAPRQQAPVLLGGPAAVGGGDWGEDTVLVGGPAGGPARSATRSIPVGGPTTPETGRESRGIPLMTSTPPGQWGDNISGAAGARGGMQPSTEQTSAMLGSAAWGAPNSAWQASRSSQAPRTRAGATARAGTLKDAAYDVLHALDDVAHAAARARGTLGTIIAEADKIGEAQTSDMWQHAEAQPMQQGSGGMPGRQDLLGAMQKLSEVLQATYRQENTAAGQGLHENVGELQHAGSSDLGLESVDTPRMPERGLGIRAQEILTVEQEEVWAAAAVELAPKEASPCADNPLAFAAAKIAGGLVKLLIFSGLALSVWTCLAFIWDYDQHVEHVLPPA